MVEMTKPIYINGKLTKYLVSNYGRVFNANTKKEKTQFFHSDMYKAVSLDIGGTSYVKRVHRLVAEAFLPNPNNLPVVNHKKGGDCMDGKWNNHVDNLEWCSYAYNNKHAYDTGLKQSIKGADHPFAKFSESMIIDICEDYMKRYSPIDISNKYGISVGLAYGIYYGLKWKHITKLYKFPKSIRWSKEYSTDDKVKIIEMISRENRNRDILKTIGYENNYKTNSFVSNIRERYNKEQCSTTNESLCRYVIQFTPLDE